MQEQPIESESLEQRILRLEETVRRLEAQQPRASKTAEKLARREEELEAKLGTYWLSRAGIMALITGIALLIIYRFGELGVLLRIVLGYALSAGLSALGWRVARRHPLFGRVLFGGGLALVYFMTYALHFVPSVRVIDSQALTLVLLAGVVIAIVAFAHSMQSETVAGIALFLGLHTGMLSEVTAFTLVSSCLLAGGAVFFLVANRWVLVPLSGLLAVYSTHASWLAARSPELAGQMLWTSLGFLALYYLLFTGAVLARADRLKSPILIAFSVLNWMGLVALGGYELWERPSLFAFLLGVAAVEALGAAGSLVLRRPRLLSVLHSALALASAGLALFFKLEGAGLALALTGIGVMSALGAWRLQSRILANVGLGLLGAASAVCFVEPDVRLVLAVLAAAFVFAQRLQPSHARGSRWSFAYAAGAGMVIAALAVRLLPMGLQTLGWASAAFVLFAVGFTLKERAYRWVGFAAVAASAVRLLVRDLVSLTPTERSITFVLLGLLLLCISFAYARLRERPLPPPGS